MKQTPGTEGKAPEIEGEARVKQAPEIEGEARVKQAPEIEGEVRVKQAPEAEGEARVKYLRLRVNLEWNTWDWGWS